MMNAYKTSMSKQKKYAGCGEFRCKSSFYGMIIRSQNELNSARKYIRENALWYDGKLTIYC